MRETLEHIAKRYIELCFELEHVVPGLVDAYTGPATLKAPKEKEPRVLTEIIAELTELSHACTQEKVTSPSRALYLHKQLEALKMLARKSLGEQVPYREEVRALYDISPSRIKESTYQETLQALHTLLPGKETLSLKLENYLQKTIIPTERILEIFQSALLLAQARTKQLFSLPPHESFEIELVTNQPWSGYNWFQGNAHSKIQINIDLPRRLDHVLHLMTHEGYAGHHTEQSLKEKILYQEQGLLECSIHPLFSPQSVISEGIADTAEEILFSKEESQEFMKQLAKTYLPHSNIDFSHYFQILQECKKLKSVPSNASFLLFEDGASENTVSEYLQEYGPLDKAFATKRVSFLKKYRGYIFTYYYGYEILSEYFSSGNSLEKFARCLTTQTIPSLIETSSKTSEVKS